MEELITREELITSKEYWVGEIQLDLFEKIEDYLTNNKMSKVDFAKQLGVDKSYVSQILNGNFNHKIEKFVELALAIGLVPRVEYFTIDKILELDNDNMLHNREYGKIYLKLNFNDTSQTQNISDYDNNDMIFQSEYKSIMYQSKNEKLEKGVANATY